MPTALVESVAKRQGKTVQEVESKWDEAKAAAAAQGHKEDWPYVVSIFKNMSGMKNK